METLRSTYDRIASDWHANHVQDDWWMEGTDKFISLLPKGAKVLDVGCGSGWKAKYLSEKGLAVTGVDFSEKMITLARDNVPDGEFHAIDLFRLDDLSGKFEGVFAQAVLLHVAKRDISNAINVLKKKLEKGGHLYIAVKEKKQNGPDEEIKKEDDLGYEYERFFSYFTAEELAGLLRQGGMDIEYISLKASGKTTWIQAIARLKNSSTIGNVEKH